MRNFIDIRAPPVCQAGTRSLTADTTPALQVGTLRQRCVGVNKVSNNDRNTLSFRMSRGSRVAPLRVTGLGGQVGEIESARFRPTKSISWEPYPDNQGDFDGTYSKNRLLLGAAWSNLPLTPHFLHYMRLSFWSLAPPNLMPSISLHSVTVPAALALAINIYLRGQTAA